MLTKSIYQDHPYDIKGQEHADLRIYRTFKSNWNTICLPISLTEEQIKKAFGENTVIAEFVNVVKANVDDGNVLQFKTTHDGIEAGKPYIMMVQDSYETNVSLTPRLTAEMYKDDFEDEYVSDRTKGYYLIEDIDLPSSDKLPALKPVQHGKYTFIGNYSPLNISQENKVLYISNNEFRYKDAGTTTKSEGYRAYFIVDESVEGSGLSKYMNFSFDETTGIVSVSLKKNAVSEPIYDLSGRKVVATLENLSSGIYIIGGKKIVIK